MPADSDSQHGYRLTLAYDGRGYYGWQRLADKPTIQAALENVAASAWGEKVMMQGAGRTDRGVHAEGQVASFQLSQDIDPKDMVHAFNEALPDDIRVVDADRVPPSFHARMAAIGKEYVYLIWTETEIPPEMDGRAWHVPRALDVSAMQEAATHFAGRHDFASFATRTAYKPKSTERVVEHALVEPCEEVIRFVVQADSFLNHMVRNMVRALVNVGEGRFAPKDITRILEARNRSASPGSAPPAGLYLMHVFFEDTPNNTSESQSDNTGLD